MGSVVCEVCEFPSPLDMRARKTGGIYAHGESRELGERNRERLCNNNLLLRILPNTSRFFTPPLDLSRGSFTSKSNDSPGAGELFGCDCTDLLGQLIETARLRRRRLSPDHDVPTLFQRAHDEQEALGIHLHAPE